MPRWAPNKVPASVKKRYFELIRAGLKGRGRCSPGRGIHELRVVVVYRCRQHDHLAPVSHLAPFLDPGRRIAFADGRRAGRPVKDIAAEIGKSFQTVYRELERNSKPDGTYQPWWAHDHALLRRRRPRSQRLAPEPRFTGR